MLPAIQFCSYWNIFQWLQNNLIGCPFKKLTGFDCPGCGFQRSLLALLQGDVVKSLQLYPATIPIIITGSFILLNKYFSFKNTGIKKYMYAFTGLIIAGSYLLKIL